MRISALMLLLTAFAFPQAPAKPAGTPKSTSPSHAARPNSSYFCNQDLGYCFDFPANWKMLGQVYEGYGAVVAPPQPGEQSEWTNVTVAAVEIPIEEGKNPPTVDDLVTSLMGKMAQQAAGMETVRRSEETLAQRPAQLLQVRYTENGKRWGETIVAMDGGGGMFYTVVYKVPVNDEAKYQKQFEEIARSFRVTQ
jgi:hypothetical protein